MPFHALLRLNTLLVIIIRVPTFNTFLDTFHYNLPFIPQIPFCIFYFEIDVKGNK